MDESGKGDAAFSRVDAGTRSEDRIPEDRISGEFPFEIVTPAEGYLNAFRQLDATRHNLPHWDQAETFVFLTFRLADSLPKEKLDQWRFERDVWLQDHPEPLDETMLAEYVRLFPARLEKWLDEGSGECLLQNADARKLVEDALVYFHGTRCDMRCFTVMPNHVHALFRMLPGHSLSNIVHSWKGYSASAINRLLGRKGPVWQKEYFDTCIRDAGHFRRVVRYIWNNAPTFERFRWADGLLTDAAGGRIPGGFVCKEGDAAFSRVDARMRAEDRIANAQGDAAFSRVDARMRAEDRIANAQGDAAFSRVDAFKMYAVRKPHPQEES